jgi:hypothetical protein
MSGREEDERVQLTNLRPERQRSVAAGSCVKTWLARVDTEVGDSQRRMMTEEQVEEQVDLLVDGLVNK